MTLSTGDQYKRGDPNQVIKKASFFASDSASTTTSLFARRIAVYKKGKDSSITVADNGFNMEFFGSDGEIKGVWTSQKAKFYENDDLELFKNVVISSKDSTIIETEYLKWYNDEKKIRSDTYVKISSPTEVVDGFGFESDAEGKNYTIFKAKGDFQVKEEEF